MKLFIGFAAVLCLSVATAKAGDGRLSNQSLAAVGLGGMQALSDDQGLDIRGLGIAEETQGQESEWGDKDHKQGEYGKDHDKKHEKKHEKHPEKPGHEVCDHKHEKDCGKSSCSHSSCAHSCCNFSSLCHIQSSAHKI